MTTRRRLIIAMGASAVGSPLASLAQQSMSPPKIGLLWIEGDSSPQYIAAFREGLRALGYVEGKDIQIDARFLVKDYDKLADAAARLVSQKVDVIVCYGATAAQAAGKATSIIPIVIVSGGNPVKLGLAASLSRPGGNVTGMTVMSQDLSGKRLDLLREIAPGIRRMAVILYPESAAEVESLRNYEAAARAMNVEVRPVEIRTPADIAATVAGISRLDVQAVAVVGSTLISANRRVVIDAIEKLRLPAMYANNDFPDAGGLLAYGHNVLGNFRKSAGYVDKILKGTKAGDIPIEQPMQFELVINVKTAKAIGLKVPRSMLVRADRVIE